MNIIKYTYKYNQIYINIIRCIYIYIYADNLKNMYILVQLYVYYTILICSFKKSNVKLKAIESFFIFY